MAPRNGAAPAAAAAARVSHGLCNSGDGRSLCQSLRRDSSLRSGHVSHPSPDAFQPMNHLDREIRKERDEKTKPRENPNQGGARNNAPAAQTDGFDQCGDDDQQDQYVSESCTDAEPDLAPVRRHAPKGAIPETLREKEQRQNAQTDSDA